MEIKRTLAVDSLDDALKIVNTLHSIKELQTDVDLIVETKSDSTYDWVEEFARSFSNIHVKRGVAY